MGSLAPSLLFSPYEIKKQEEVLRTSKQAMDRDKRGKSGFRGWMIWEKISTFQGFSPFATTSWDWYLKMKLG